MFRFFKNRNHLQNAYKYYSEILDLMKNNNLDIELFKKIDSLIEKAWLYHYFSIFFGYVSDRKRLHKIQEKNNL